MWLYQCLILYEVGESKQCCYLESWRIHTDRKMQPIIMQSSIWCPLKWSSSRQALGLSYACAVKYDLFMGQTQESCNLCNLISAASPRPAARTLARVGGCGCSSFPAPFAIFSLLTAPCGKCKCKLLQIIWDNRLQLCCNKEINSEGRYAKINNMCHKLLQTAIHSLTACHTGVRQQKENGKWKPTKSLSWLYKYLCTFIVTFYESKLCKIYIYCNCKLFFSLFTELKLNCSPVEWIWKFLLLIYVLKVY